MNHHTKLMAGKVGHGFCCFVCYVELKIAPTEYHLAVFSIYVGLTHYYAAPYYLPPSAPMGVLVVLA